MELISQLVGNPVAVSRVYESPPWGYASKHLFLNCCLSLDSVLDPLPLIDVILSIEKTLGRERSKKGYTDRLVDIDLLFFGDKVINHSRLKIPHPALEQRRFVLVPLVEIAPDFVHPVTGFTVKQMLKRCQDRGSVRPV